MFKILTSAVAVAAAISATTAVAAPATPSLSWEDQNYSFVEINLDGRGSYKQLVKTKKEVQINIKWNAWSGSAGDTYKVYFDDQVVHQGPVSAGSNGGTISFPYTKSGRHDLRVELCDATGCSKSAAKPIVIADTDGGHLAPLAMNVDPNNKTYPKQTDTVVGAYFVEWGIYGRDYDVTKIPVDNLTHILYGFIPICGENSSLGEIENGNSLRALQLACGDSKDYEVVIHDPWAAIQKALPGINSKDPIRGTYAQLMALKQRNPDLKILPSVGGWTLSDPFHGFTVKANRDVFVNSMKEFLTTWKFYDGIDIDWEFPGGGGPNANLGSPEDGAAYVALMKELRAMLDGLEAETGRKYELSSAIGTGYDKIEDVDYKQASQYMDYIFAMTYDFFGGWNNVTGHQTALYCGSHLSAGECNGTGVDDQGNPRKGPAYTIDNAIKLLLQQGVPSKKLVVGTAMYGRGWEGVYPQNATIADNPMTAPGNGKLTGTKAQGVWEAGVIDYKGVKSYMIGANELGVNGFEVGYDEQAQGAYVWNRSTGKLITYDSPRSVKAKGQYVRANNLGGLFAWEIDADNGDILNAMHEGLGASDTPVDRAPVVDLISEVTIDSGKSATVSATATDPEGKAVSFQWSADAALTLTANGASVSVAAPTVTVDSVYTLSLKVSDGKNEVNRQVKVIVKAPASDNKAPVVGTVADVTVDEKASTSLSVTANDPENQALTYTWSVPGHTVTGSGSSVTLTANEVTATETVQGTVSVSDGVNTVSRTFNVTVNNLADTGKTTWDANTVYVGGDLVWYEGKQYKARWWTRGENPSTSSVWQEVAAPNDGRVDSNDWTASKAYTGGSTVTFNGEQFQARWWTQGEEPLQNSVWRKL